MPVLGSKPLQGLTANDRSLEDKQAIDSLTGNTAPVQEIPDTVNTDTTSIPTYGNKALINQLHNRYLDELDERYQQLLNERREEYGVDRESTNSNANEYLDKIGNEVSSYYKKFNGTDKLPLSDDQKKQMAAAYDARKKVYGEDNANVWLDSQFKDIVGNNQSWWEQGLNAVSHLIPAIEGGAIQAYGMVHGAINHILGTEGYNDNSDLNWWDSFMDDVIDNPVTRYGRDVELAGASNILQGFSNAVGLSDESAAERIAATKASATKYNPEGIGADAIVTTSDQDDAFISSATPWQALQSGGFTALSMLVGAGEAKMANWLFNGMAKGANWLNSTGKALKSAEALEKALVGIKRVQNITDTFVIPAAVGTMEGGLEGLSTKIDVEREAVQNLDEYYKDKVNKEAEAILQDDRLNPMVEVPTDNGRKEYRRSLDSNAVYQQVWDKYKDEYVDARRQIDWASSKAGIHNFYANSLINGAMNQTLKAGLMAPRVQETLRNSRAFGWAYRNPRFNVSPTGEATSAMSKSGWIGRVLKEPIGEGAEEYAQSLSNDIFSSAAENNINEFIKNRFEGDGTVKVTDSFGSDYAAALTALEGSLTNKESIQSAILGAVSSTMGTVGGIGRGYHRDENGNLIQNSLFDPKNLTRGLDSEGNQESWFDYARRVTPWRSGAINAYFDRIQEMDDANETAATLTEWLKDPQNKGKWDGLTGTANWITQMENAAESNDQFSYRKAQMGKAINDIFMLKKLEGTDFHDAVMADLQKAANGEVSQEEITKMRQSRGEDYQDISDQELVEKVQSNANRMLGLMSQVEQESKNLDRLMGRMDEDTKQSLIFGKVMEQDFRERRDQLQEEIDTIKSRIQNSKSSNLAHSLEDNLANLMMKYGSINQALHEQSQLQSKKEKLQQRVEELEAIDKSKTSDKQKEELIKSKQELKKVNKELEGLDALYERGEKGKKTDQVDSSLAQLVLNEQAIMDLDPITRAIVLAQGANKLYNATHQDRQKVDQLNLEIDDINHQIDALEAQKAKWTSSDGRVKKGHNKQYERNTKKVEELQRQKEAKMRALDAEQGKQDTKPVYSAQQQEVIDNLVQQGIAQDRDFLDKVVDMGRLEKGIKDYHQQYQAILSDPKAFQNYVQRAKYNAQKDLTKRRAERIAGIQNYQEYAQELDRLTANASQQEMNDIFAALRNEDTKQKRAYQNDNMVVDENTGDLIAPTETPKTNYDRYMENVRKQGDLVRQFAKNQNLTGNDQSLLLDAMQYLSSKGINLDDRDAAVQALIEKDEQGNVGGKFRQFVEAKNDQRLPQQRTFMPQFTSIGQIVGQYVDLINGTTEDAINRGNANPTITQATPDPGQPVQPTVVPSPSPSAPPVQPEAAQQQAPVSAGATSKKNQDAVQDTVDDNGTVSTGAQTKVMQQRQQHSEPENKSVRQQMWEQVTTPEIAAMVDASSNIIDNSNESAEVIDIARQYMVKIPVVSDERLDTIDDVLTAIQKQITRLQEMSNQQEKQDNDYQKAAGLLQKVYGSLTAKKMRGRRRTAPVPASRPEEPKANWIHTANIAYIQNEINPEAWAVQFTDDHAIDEWNRNNSITEDTPVYFITDSEWTAEVTRQMSPTPEMLSINPNARKYDRLNDLPIVAAVRIETPADPTSTTAIEVDGLWYQPIGIMPGSKAKTQGAARVFDIRKLASQEQGRHLITEDGMANGKPLTTRVYGANYLTAHHPDASGQSNRQNTAESNTDIIEGILRDLPRDSEDRLKALPREEMLSDPEYMEARNKVLNAISWNADKGMAEYTSDNHRQGETGNPMLLFVKPMSETTGRTDSRKLTDVLENGTGEDVRSFNSRTQRLYDEVIRPVFQFIQRTPTTNKGEDYDRSAHTITQEEVDEAALEGKNAFEQEADRLTKLLNGYDGTDDSKGMRGLRDFIWIKKGQGWSLKVTAPESLQVIGNAKYKVFFVNQDSSVAPIELGTINAGQRDTDAALELLRNIMWDKETGQVRDFLNWQLPESDVQNANNPKNTKARQNIASILDDGFLTFAGSSLSYDVDGVKLRAPISMGGKILYPSDQIVNPVNAQPAAPQNVTPQGDGAIVTNSGQSVDPDSGASLGGSSNNSPASSPAPQKSAKLRQAEAITQKIISDSKEFTLSKDDSYYYIVDKNTGEEIKYLRVTTVIGADESATQWEPSINDILDKLKERHAIGDSAYNVQYRDTQDMSQKLNIPVSDIKRAVAELRTAHKKEGYGAWSTPSTSIGNTFDIITRDFLAGHLNDTYPNVSKEVQETFIHQLELFKADCDAQGIHLVSEGVMAHGTITMTDDEGNTHDVKVAGTLDLFGYDDAGNFYIFDMKTTRDHTEEKLKKEKGKWSRQISMYADLLKQSYPGFSIISDRLRIIPININYPKPMGKSSEHLDPSGPQYSEIKEGEKKGQLQMQYRRQSEPQDFTMEMPKNPKEGNGDNAVGMRKTAWRDQYNPGYTPFNINWDNLSSEDQDIASALVTQTGDSNNPTVAPQSASVETPRPKRSAIISPVAYIDDYAQSTQNAGPTAPPIIPNGITSLLPSWNNLTPAQKERLILTYGEDMDADYYGDLLSTPSEVDILRQILKCSSTM